MYAMEPRISLITLGVADLARSRAFYEALGFKASSVGGGQVVFFQLGPLALSLFPRESLACDAKVSAEGSGFSGITLAHNVRSKEDVAAVIAEAERVGGRVVKASEEAPWGGQSGYFADPDGHLWEVAWNPHFPLAEDGALTLPQ
jgi:catechol 2,3-dioxygenase-like lactoylglutathione lyase family enzyme